MEYQGYKMTVTETRGNIFFLGGKRVAEKNVPQEVRDYFYKQPDELGEVEGADFTEQPDTPETEATEEQIQDALNSADFDEMLAQEGLKPTEDKMPSSFEMELIEQIEELKAQLAEKEEGSKDSKDIFALAKELYDRFGVYTVFTGVAPRENDIHPFSGEVMTRYEVGLAYQKYNMVTAQGKLNKDFGAQYELTEKSRAASKEHVDEMNRNRHMSAAEHQKRNTFDFRTSVKGQNQSSMVTKPRNNDPISEEATKEPNLNGQTIRPVW